MDGVAAFVPVEVRADGRPEIDGLVIGEEGVHDGRAGRLHRRW